jgi:FAD/FMN-containing dehydrogenase
MTTPATTTILDDLRSIVGAERVFTDATSLKTYGQDWTRFYPPKPAGVVLPGSVEEVQAIVRLANQRGFALVPSGGRTGLSAAAVATNGEIVVAFDRMNKILDFDATDQSVLCQPGVITQQLQDFAASKSMFYPVDFASAGSSQIGGNINTNAGGIKVIRYGMTRDWVLGLKVVTGSGELLELNHGLVKNNCGYDLRHLFIGSEGTLGLVVEATIQLTRAPQSLQVMVLGVPEFAAIMEVLACFKASLNLTAFEFFSEAALTKVVEYVGTGRPFVTVTPYYALLEFETIAEHDLEKAIALFETCVENGWVLDGTISQSQQQAANLWRLREDISETVSRWTPYKNDLSVRVSRVPAFMAEIDALIEAMYPEWEVIWYGHIGDGNTHINILKPTELSIDDFRQCCEGVSKSVFEIVQRYGGSISAEHGVGLIKKDYLNYSRSDAEINLMRQIKKAFDPNGIMNPGKIFD